MAPTTLLVGCGRLGGAILTGWRLTGAVAMADLAILSPSTKPLIEDAVRDGAVSNPDSLATVSRVVLAVKPARWREAAAGLVRTLPPRAAIVSVMAGVRADALAAVFHPRPVSRIMPTTAVAAAKGAAAVWAADDASRDAAVALFAPLATLVQVDEEDLIDVATAVSGSGAAYAYAFVRALARAGAARGLEPDAAKALAMATIAGALARLGLPEADASSLIAEVASPGGTTEAGLRVLEPALSDLLDRTVEASLDRVRTLDPGA